MNPVNEQRLVAGNRIPFWHSLQTRVTLATLAVFLLAIWIFTFFTNRLVHQTVEQQFGARQFATVSMLAADINQEFGDRLRALKTVATTMTPALLRDSAALQEALKDLALLHQVFNGGIAVAGPDGTVLADFPKLAGRTGGNFSDRDYIIGPLQGDLETISKPVRSKVTQAPSFVIAVPIRDAHARVIGVLAGIINLGKPNFLDPITELPYGTAGGYLLIAQRHRLIVTATDRKRVMETLPVPAVGSLFERFLKGYEGTGVAVNPRGVEVLASAKTIPLAGWNISAAIPTEDAFAPAHELQRRILITAFLLTLMAGALTWLLLRRQLAPMRAAAKTLIAASNNKQFPPALPVGPQDEVGLLIGGFNRLLESLARQQQAVLESEARYRGLFDNNHTVMLLIDPDTGAIVAANPAAAAFYGWAQAQLLGMKMDRINTLATTELLALMQLAHDKQRKHFEFRHRCADGSIREVEVFSGPVQIDGKKLIYSIVHDISQRKRAEAQLRESEVLRSNEQATTLEVRGKAQLAALNLAEDAIGARRQAEAAFAALRESEQRHRLLADNATDVIWTMDLEGRFTYVSPSVIKLRGYTPAEMMQQSPTQIFCAESARIATEARRRSLASMAAGLPFDGFRGDLEQMCKDGSTVWTEVATSGMQDEKGEFVGILGVTRNISAQKEQQRQLQHLAHFDALTNLPNRLLLADRLQQGLTQAERRAQTLAVAYIDLDGFKAINDHHGHAIGDQVLIALASSMKKALREGDTFARLGGDEFVAVLIDLEDMSASLALLKRLLTAAAEPVRVGELILQVSASLGVTFYPQAQNIDSDQLLRQADQAMYQAKLAGKNRYHVFDAELDSSMRMHHESVEHIRMALERREFVLHYQPKVNLCSGQVIGAEALIRWQHPQQGLLSPGHFLPVIEDHPLAVAIGAWVIDTALTQLKIWHGAGLNLVVSVNVGARQLQRPDFIDQLRTTLAAHSGVNPSFLELEILETSALEDIERVSQVIEDCAALGVGCALDDFGTGYSSLTYLKRLRVGMLKIDKSFVRDMLDDPDDLAILQGVIGLAGAFRVDVIAEGVETLAHARLLLQLGCELAQGDGIARAMPAHQLPAWAAAWPGEPFWSELVADSQARSPVSLLRS